MLSKSQDCPLSLGGRAQRRGYYPRKYYHLPLFEGTPPTLGGEFKVLDNIYIIT